MTCFVLQMLRAGGPDNGKRGSKSLLERNEEFTLPSQPAKKQVVAVCYHHSLKA